MNKVLGYVLVGVGLLIFLLSFPKVANVVKIPLPAGATSNVLMIIGVVIIGVGAFIVSKGTSSAPKEVPIYHGKEVVGFRRVK